MNPIPDRAACAIAETLEPCLSELRSLAHFPSVTEIDRIVGPRAGVRFFEAKPKGRRLRGRSRVPRPVDPRELYDGSIALRGEVPTRPRSAHDLWNALVWSVFPRAKRTLHTRQHRLIASGLEPGATELPPKRTREQDTIAMIDEGGVLLVCEPHARGAIEAALESRTSDALDALRSSFTGLVFGHAIYEELARGPSRVLGFSVIVETSPVPGETIVATADRVLAGMLSDPERFLSPEGHRGTPVDARTFAPFARAT